MPGVSRIRDRLALAANGAALLALVAAVGCDNSTFKGKAASPTSTPAPTTHADDANSAASDQDASTAGGNTNTALDTGGNGPGSVDTASKPPPALRLALLMDNIQCGFCHTEVHGSLGSVGDVAPMRSDSIVSVLGKWLVTGAFNGKADFDATSTGKVDVRDGIMTNYGTVAPELPRDGSGKVIFPDLDFSTLKPSGTVYAPATGMTLPLAKSAPGNLMLYGTKDQPIEIKGDFVVNGDLIIKGVYKGRGTIYARGAIYLPANLVATSYPTFPYPDDEKTAEGLAATDVANKSLDALGLAAEKSIFVADLENYTDKSVGLGAVGSGLHGTKYVSVYDKGANAPDRFLRANVGIEHVYTWYPEAKYDALYEKVATCATNFNRDMVGGAAAISARSFDRIDAFLYTRNVVAGVARGNSYSINGGIIARDMHIISGAAFAGCPTSKLNYDYRLRKGLRILEALAPFFPGT